LELVKYIIVEFWQKIVENSALRQIRFRQNQSLLLALVIEDEQTVGRTISYVEEELKTIPSHWNTDLCLVLGEEFSEKELESVKDIFSERFRYRKIIFLQEVSRQNLEVLVDTLRRHAVRQGYTIISLINSGLEYTPGSLISNLKILCRETEPVVVSSAPAQNQPDILMDMTFWPRSYAALPLPTHSAQSYIERSLNPYLVYNEGTISGVSGDEAGRWLLRCRDNAAGNGLSPIAAFSNASASFTIVESELPSDETVIVFSTHPDDEALLKKTIQEMVKRGCRVVILGVTGGKLNLYPKWYKERLSGGRKAEAEYMHLRYEESKRACRVMYEEIGGEEKGYHPITYIPLYLGFEDSRDSITKYYPGGRIRSNIYIPGRITVSDTERVIRLLDKYGASTIFLPYPYDTHPSHIAAADLGMLAAQSFSSRMSRSLRCFAYAGESSSLEEALQDVNRVMLLTPREYQAKREFLIREFGSQKGAWMSRLLKQSQVRRQEYIDTLALRTGLGSERFGDAELFLEFMVYPESQTSPWIKEVKAPLPEEAVTREPVPVPQTPPLIPDARTVISTLLSLATLSLVCLLISKDIIGVYFIRDIFVSVSIIVSMNIFAQKVSAKSESLNLHEIYMLAVWSIILASFGDAGEVLINNFIDTENILITGFLRMIANTFLGFIIATQSSFVQRKAQREETSDEDFADKILDIYFVKTIVALVFNFLKSILIPLELRGFVTIIKQVPDKFFQMWVLKRESSIFGLRDKFISLLATMHYLRLPFTGWIFNMAREKLGADLPEISTESQNGDASVLPSRYVYDSSRRLFSDDSSKIKVLQLATHFKVSGGLAQATASVSRLNNRQYEVAIVAGATPAHNLWTSLIKEAEENGIIFGGILPDLEVNRPKPLALLKGFVLLYRLFRRERPDVVNAHNTFLAAMAAKLAGVPVVILTHHTSADFAFDAFGKVKGLLALWLDKITVHIFCDYVLNMAETVYKQRIEDYGWPRKKTGCISIPLDLERFEAAAGASEDLIQQRREMLGVGGRNPIIATVARIDRLKGYDYLVEAVQEIVQEYPGAVLLAIGRFMSDEYEREIKSRISSLGLEENIRFLGHRDDVPAILSSADIFVLPSLTESFAMVVPEACAAGLPVVATDVGDISLHIKDGVSGFIVSPRDSPALASAISEMLSDPARAEVLARTGRASVLAKYGREGVMQEFEELFLNLAKGKKPLASRLGLLPEEPTRGFSIRPNLGNLKNSAINLLRNPKFQLQVLTCLFLAGVFAINGGWWNLQFSSLYLDEGSHLLRGLRGYMTGEWEFAGFGLVPVYGFFWFLSGIWEPVAGARLMSNILGVASSLFVFLYARELLRYLIPRKDNEYTAWGFALIAAAVYSIAPATLFTHCYVSHDVVMHFFFSLGLWKLAEGIRRDKDSSFIISGAVFALAAAAKVVSLPAVIFLLAASLVLKGKKAARYFIIPFMFTFSAFTIVFFEYFDALVKSYLFNSDKFAFAGSGAAQETVTGPIATLLNLAGVFINKFLGAFSDTGYLRSVSNFYDRILYGIGISSLIGFILTPKKTKLTALLVFLGGCVMPLVHIYVEPTSANKHMVLSVAFLAPLVSFVFYTIYSAVLSSDKDVSFKELKATALRIGLAAAFVVIIPLSLRHVDYIRNSTDIAWRNTTAAHEVIRQEIEADDYVYTDVGHATTAELLPQLTESSIDAQIRTPYYIPEYLSSVDGRIYPEGENETILARLRDGVFDWVVLEGKTARLDIAQEFKDILQVGGRYELVYIEDPDTDRWHGVVRVYKLVGESTPDSVQPWRTFDYAKEMAKWRTVEVIFLSVLGSFFLVKCFFSRKLQAFTSRFLRRRRTGRSIPLVHTPGLVTGNAMNSAKARLDKGFNEADVIEEATRIIGSGEINSYRVIDKGPHLDAVLEYYRLTSQHIKAMRLRRAVKAGRLRAGPLETAYAFNVQGYICIADNDNPYSTEALIVHENNRGTEEQDLEAERAYERFKAESSQDIWDGDIEPAPVETIRELTACAEVSGPGNHTAVANPMVDHFHPHRHQLPRQWEVQELERVVGAFVLTNPGLAEQTQLFEETEEYEQPKVVCAAVEAGTAAQPALLRDLVMHLSTDEEAIVYNPIIGIDFNNKDLGNIWINILLAPFTIFTFFLTIFVGPLAYILMLVGRKKSVLSILQFQEYVVVSIIHWLWGSLSPTANVKRQGVFNTDASLTWGEYLKQRWRWMEGIRRDMARTLAARYPVAEIGREKTLDSNTLFERLTCWIRRPQPKVYNYRMKHSSFAEVLADPSVSRTGKVYLSVKHPQEISFIPGVRGAIVTDAYSEGRVTGEDRWAGGEPLGVGIIINVVPDGAVIVTYGGQKIHLVMNPSRLTKAQKLITAVNYLTGRIGVEIDGQLYCGLEVPGQETAGKPRVPWSPYDEQMREAEQEASRQLERQRMSARQAYFDLSGQYEVSLGQEDTLRIPAEVGFRWGVGKLRRLLSRLTFGKLDGLLFARGLHFFMSMVGYYRPEEIIDETEGALQADEEDTQDRLRGISNLLSRLEEKYSVSAGGILSHAGLPDIRRQDALLLAREIIDRVTSAMAAGNPAARYLFTGTQKGYRGGDVVKPFGWIGSEEAVVYRILTDYFGKDNYRQDRTWLWGPRDWSRGPLRLSDYLFGDASGSVDTVFENIVYEYLEAAKEAGYRIDRVLLSESASGRRMIVVAPSAHNILYKGAGNIDVEKSGYGQEHGLSEYEQRVYDATSFYSRGRLEGMEVVILTPGEYEILTDSGSGVQELREAPCLTLPSFVLSSEFREEMLAASAIERVSGFEAYLIYVARAIENGETVMSFYAWVIDNSYIEPTGEQVKDLYSQMSRYWLSRLNETLLEQGLEPLSQEAEDTGYIVPDSRDEALLKSYFGDEDQVLDLYDHTRWYSYVGLPFPVPFVGKIRIPIPRPWFPMNQRVNALAVRYEIARGRYSSLFGISTLPEIPELSLLTEDNLLGHLLLTYPHGPVPAVLCGVSLEAILALGDSLDDRLQGFIHNVFEGILRANEDVVSNELDSHILRSFAPFIQNQFALSGTSPRGDVGRNHIPVLDDWFGGASWQDVRRRYEGVYPYVIGMSYRLALRYQHIKGFPEATSAIREYWGDDTCEKLPVPFLTAAALSLEHTTDELNKTVARISQRLAAVFQGLEDMRGSISIPYQYQQAVYVCSRKLPESLRRQFLLYLQEWGVEYVTDIAPVVNRLPSQFREVLLSEIFRRDYRPDIIFSVIRKEFDERGTALRDIISRPAVLRDRYLRVRRDELLEKDIVSRDFIYKLVNFISNVAIAVFLFVFFKGVLFTIMDTNLVNFSASKFMLEILHITVRGSVFWFAMAGANLFFWTFFSIPLRWSMNALINLGVWLVFGVRILINQLQVAGSRLLERESPSTITPINPVEAGLNTIAFGWIDLYQRIPSYDYLSGNLDEDFGEIIFDPTGGENRFYSGRRASPGAGEFAAILNRALNSLESRLSVQTQLAGYLRQIMGDITSQVTIVVSRKGVLDLTSVRHKNTVIFNYEFAYQCIEDYEKYPLIVEWLVAERLFHELGHIASGINGDVSERRRVEGELIQQDVLLYEFTLGFLIRGRPLQNLINEYFSIQNPRIDFRSGHYFEFLNILLLLPSREYRQRIIDMHLDRVYPEGIALTDLDAMGLTSYSGGNIIVEGGIEVVNGRGLFNPWSFGMSEVSYGPLTVEKINMFANALAFNLNGDKDLLNNLALVVTSGAARVIGRKDGHLQVTVGIETLSRQEEMAHFTEEVIARLSLEKQSAAGSKDIHTMDDFKQPLRGVIPWQSVVILMGLFSGVVFISLKIFGVPLYGLNLISSDLALKIAGSIAGISLLGAAMFILWWRSWKTRGPPGDENFYEAVHRVSSLPRITKKINRRQNIDISDWNNSPDREIILKNIIRLFLKKVENEQVKSFSSLRLIGAIPGLGIINVLAQIPLINLPLLIIGGILDVFFFFLTYRLFLKPFLVPLGVFFAWRQNYLEDEEIGNIVAAAIQASKQNSAVYPSKISRRYLQFTPLDFIIVYLASRTNEEALLGKLKNGLSVSIVILSRGVTAVVLQRIWIAFIGKYITPVILHTLFSPQFLGDVVLAPLIPVIGRYAISWQIILGGLVLALCLSTPSIIQVWKQSDNAKRALFQTLMVILKSWVSLILIGPQMQIAVHWTNGIPFLGDAVKAMDIYVYGKENHNGIGQAFWEMMEGTTGIHLDTTLYTPLAYIFNKGYGLESARAATLFYRNNDLAEQYEEYNHDWQIQGYSGDSSVAQGGELEFYVYTDNPLYEVEIYRQGLDLQPLTSPIVHQTQAGGANVMDFTIPSHWQSGAYFMKISADFDDYSYIPFVVTEDEPGSFSDMLFVVDTLGDQAHNNFGGQSLFEYNSFNGVPAEEVSLSRPLNFGDGAGSFFQAKADMVSWLERRGYGLEYATDIDIDNNPDILSNYSLIIEVGPDTVWTPQRVEAYEEYIGNGGNLVVFAASPAVWQADINSGNLSIAWDVSGERVGGLNYAYGGNAISGLAAVNTGNWVYEGVDIQEGEMIVGEEVLVPADLPPASVAGLIDPRGVTVLGFVPVSGEGQGVMILKRTPSGGMIFNSGTERVVSALGDDDSAFSGIVSNVIYNLSGKKESVVSLTAFREFGGFGNISFAEDSDYGSVLEVEPRGVLGIR
ncbi:MAG: glycosyltransferase, partial [Candidatus Omnitrophica bacterium]|nr:glycosyltransferase [Candidatus Omnitrophota bacterium]MBD3268774.1 glycosyltransferase [Candidatus Omnitrophota bacterium]